MLHEGSEDGAKVMQVRDSHATQMTRIIAFTASCVFV